MKFYTNNINLVISQSAEVAKIKKKELNKSKLDRLGVQSDFEKVQNENLVHDVESKDTTIELLHHEEKEKPKERKPEEQVDKKKKSILKLDYKGNFLDFKG